YISIRIFLIVCNADTVAEPATAFIGRRRSSCQIRLYRTWAANQRHDGANDEIHSTPGAFTRPAYRRLLSHCRGSASTTGARILARIVSASRGGRSRVSRG